MTPLILAARMGNREIVEMLLSHGADPTVHTHEGETALSVAAKVSYIGNYPPGSSSFNIIYTGTLI